MKWYMKRSPVLRQALICDREICTDGFQQLSMRTTGLILNHPRPARSAGTTLAFVKPRRQLWTWVQI